MRLLPRSAAGHRKLCTVGGFALSLISGSSLLFGAPVTDDHLTHADTSASLKPPPIEPVNEVHLDPAPEPQRPERSALSEFNHDVLPSVGGMCGLAAGVMWLGGTPSLAATLAPVCFTPPLGPWVCAGGYMIGTVATGIAADAADGHFSTYSDAGSLLMSGVSGFLQGHNNLWGALIKSGAGRMAASAITSAALGRTYAFSQEIRQAPNWQTAAKRTLLNPLVLTDLFFGGVWHEHGEKFAVDVLVSKASPQLQSLSEGMSRSAKNLFLRSSLLQAFVQQGERLLGAANPKFLSHLSYAGYFLKKGQDATLSFMLRGAPRDQIAEIVHWAGLAEAALGKTKPLRDAVLQNEREYLRNGLRLLANEGGDVLKRAADTVVAGVAPLRSLKASQVIRSLITARTELASESAGRLPMWKHALQSTHEELLSLLKRNLLSELATMQAEFSKQTPKSAVVLAKEFRELKSLVGEATELLGDETGRIAALMGKVEALISTQHPNLKFVLNRASAPSLHLELKGTAPARIADVIHWQGKAGQEPLSTLAKESVDALKLAAEKVALKDELSVPRDAFGRVLLDELRPAEAVKALLNLEKEFATETADNSPVWGEALLSVIEELIQGLKGSLPSELARLQSEFAKPVTSRLPPSLLKEFSELKPIVEDAARFLDDEDGQLLATMKKIEALVQRHYPNMTFISRPGSFLRRP